MNKSCSLLCKESYSLREMKRFAKKIKQEYRVQWYVLIIYSNNCAYTDRIIVRLIDGLPAATKHLVIENNDQNRIIYERGFSLGFIGDEAKVFSFSFLIRCTWVDVSLCSTLVPLMESHTSTITSK